MRIAVNNNDNDNNNNNNNGNYTERVEKYRQIGISLGQGGMKRVFSKEAYCYHSHLS